MAASPSLGPQTREGGALHSATAATRLLLGRDASQPEEVLRVRSPGESGQSSKDSIPMSCATVKRSDRARNSIRFSRSGLQALANFSPDEEGPRQISDRSDNEDEKNRRTITTCEVPKFPPDEAASCGEQQSEKRNSPLVCDMTRGRLNKGRTLPRLQIIEAADVVAKWNATRCGVPRRAVGGALPLDDNVADLLRLLRSHLEVRICSVHLAGSNDRHEARPKGRKAAFGPRLDGGVRSQSEQTNSLSAAAFQTKPRSDSELMRPLYMPMNLCTGPPNMADDRLAMATDPPASIRNYW